MPLQDQTTWLRGDKFHCLQPPIAFGRPWRLVLLGAPGAGKGTQSAMLATLLGACPLSTGDIFRVAQERADSWSSMIEVNDRLARGQLVPDDIVLGVIRARRRCLRCHAGFLLDGFPRTIVQALTLDGLLAEYRLHLDAVIHYEVPMTELVSRLSGRRVCNRCQAPYHITNRPPKVDGLCDRCGGPVTRRADDEPAAVRARLIAYVTATAEVADYYRKQDLLITIPATGSPEAVFATTVALLAARGLPVPRESSDSPGGSADDLDLPPQTP